MSVLPRTISDEALQALINYDWRGNVRELQNAIERAVALSDGRIEISHLPNKVQATSLTIRDLNGQIMTLDELERRYILDTLSRERDDKARVAELLGIDLSTLYRKLKRYGR